MPTVITLGSSHNTGDVDMTAFSHDPTIDDSHYNLISIYPTGISYGFNFGIGADDNEYENILDKDYKQLFNYPSYDKTEFLASSSYFNRIHAQEIMKGRGTEKGGVYIDLSNEETRNKLS